MENGSRHGTSLKIQPLLDKPGGTALKCSDHNYWNGIDREQKTRMVQDIVLINPHLVYTLPSRVSS